MTWLLTSQARECPLVGIAIGYPTSTPSLPEIAHALAQINRFTGHASRAYSVAEHSLLVMQIAADEYGADAGGQLAALMHDAHECITGDVASPVKMVLGDSWNAFEDAHEYALRSHYGLLSLYQQHSAMVKQCDLIALATERRDLMPFDADTNTPWPVLDTPGAVVQPWAYAQLGTDQRAYCRPSAWARSFETKARDLLRCAGHNALRVAP